jgi:recombination protein RecT
MSGPTPEVGTTVARPKAARDQMKQELARYVPSYEKLLPKGYTGERLVTGALVSMMANPELLKCDPASVALACARVAQWGLDLGTTAHLVPFGKVCTPIPDYKGLIEILCAAGVRKVEAREVRQGEHFEFALGTDPYLRHQPNGKSNAPIVAAYAIAWLRTGVTQFEVMTADEINQVRSKSKSWAKGELTYWYARKTVIRRLAKYVAKSPRLNAVLRADEVDLGEAVDADDELLARLEPGPASYLPGNHAQIRDGGYQENREPVTPEVKTEVVDMAARPAPEKPLPADPYVPAAAEPSDQQLDGEILARER